jgi:hypothetical protein
MRCEGGGVTVQEVDHPIVTMRLLNKQSVSLKLQSKTIRWACTESQCYSYISMDHKTADACRRIESD